MIEPIDQFEFHHRLGATPGTALVAFTARGCGACRHLEGALTELARCRPDLHLFEVDAQVDTALVRELEVFHLPALFLYRDGHFHCELHARPTPDALAEAIERALQAPAGEAP
jgi:hypothetical protein